MRQLPENFFGWNDHKSIMLTKFATLAVAMGCVVMVLCGPRIVSWVWRCTRCSWCMGQSWGIFCWGWAIAAPRWPCGCCITCTCFGAH